MDIEELGKKIDKYHEENTKNTKKGQYINLSYILWGFTLAMVGLVVSSLSPTGEITGTTITNIIALALFFGGGWVSLFYSMSFK